MKLSPTSPVPWCVQLWLMPLLLQLSRLPLKPRLPFLPLLPLFMLLTACSSVLAPAPQLTLARYAFEVAAPPVRLPAAGAPVLVVNPLRAASGYGSHRMLYVRKAQQLEYFAQNEWVDTPANMLLPLLVGSLANSGIYSAVLPASASAQGQLTLDVELVRLQHEFTTVPSAVHATLRVALLDSSTRQVLAWRELDARVAANTGDPYGGVLATRAVLQSLLQQLGEFCRQAGAAKPRETD